MGNALPPVYAVVYSYPQYVPARDYFDLFEQLLRAAGSIRTIAGTQGTTSSGTTKRHEAILMQAKGQWNS